MCACVRVQSGGAVVERMARDIFVDRPAASVYLHRDTKKWRLEGVLTISMVLVKIVCLWLRQGHDLTFPEYGSAHRVPGGSWRDRRALCHMWFRELETRYLPI
jgi:hypothetical protein